MESILGNSKIGLGLYQDNGLTIILNIKSQQTNKIRKMIWSIFKNRLQNWNYNTFDGS